MICPLGETKVLICGGILAYETLYDVMVIDLKDRTAEQMNNYVSRYKTFRFNSQTESQLIDSGKVLALVKSFEMNLIKFSSESKGIESVCNFGRRA